MAKMGNKQIVLFRTIQELGGTATKGQIVEAHRSKYFCNASHHIGAVLSRMVNSGFLIRPRRGVYSIASAAGRTRGRMANCEGTLRIFPDEASD